MKALILIFLGCLAFSSQAKEYECLSLKWVYPGGSSTYKPKVIVTVSSNTIKVDAISYIKNEKHQSNRFKETNFVVKDSVKKFGFTVQSTVEASNDKAKVVFTKGPLSGYIEYKTTDGYGFKGNCST